MQWIKDFYGNLIDLIGFIVGKTSDQGADIVIRALPLVSPAPNAISVYYVSQTALNFRPGQALVFACTVEFLLFGLFEVTLLMFDGFQGNSRRYKYPFWIMLAVSTLVMFLIIGVVYYVESAHTILAVLPLFSAAGATALALKRWHVRNINDDLERSTQTAETLMVVQDALNSERLKHQAYVEQLNVDREKLLYEVARLNGLIEAKSTPVQQEQQLNSDETDSRRKQVLNHYRSNPYASYQDVANALGVPKSTIYNDVQGFKRKRIVHINGNGVEVLNDL